MSDCMIIRRGGGGQGFDPNGAVLKVVTSTGCTVAVTNATAGYSKTHQQADGYPRSNNADVTEHFFSIPSSAFGTLAVVATNTYGDNAKTIAVDTAGKVYELLCAGLNIIFNGAFGLKEGYSVSTYYSYDAYNKALKRNSSPFNDAKLLNEELTVTGYSALIFAGSSGRSETSCGISLRDENGYELCYASVVGSGRDIKSFRAVYPTASLYVPKSYSPAYITEIVLS